MPISVNPSSPPSEAPSESDFSARKLRIAAICLIGMVFGTYLVISGAMSFLMLPITQDFHWTRLQFSFAVSALLWAGALVMPLAGNIADRIGARPVILASTAILGVFSLLMGRQTGHVWAYCLCLGLAGVFGQTNAIYSKVIGTLFTQNRGKALGIFYMAMGVMMGLQPQITNFLLMHVGWRGVFSTYGVIVLALLPLVYFGLEEPGRSSSGGTLGRVRSGRVAALQSTPAALVGMTAREARRDKTFWILGISWLCEMALAQGWAQHHVAFLVGRGFTPTQVANVITISFLFQPLVIFLSGYAMDRIQNAKIAAPFALLGALGMAIEWLAWAKDSGGMLRLVVGATLCGFALGSALNIQTYFFTRYFGIRSFAEIFGLAMAVQNVASGFGPPVIGKLFDHTGSYNLVVLLIIIAYVVSATLILALGRYRYSVDLREPATAPAEAASIPAAAGRT
jgi:MFS family permease